MTPAMIWGLFGALVVLMLFIDLGVVNRRAHVVSVREALVWSGVWIALSLLFNAGLWAWLGPQKALEFLTGYLIEKSLSVDNLFVFLLIFSYFQVPARYQHQILFWGILGALVMRALFIAGGVVLIHRFHWVMYAFGLFLIVTGMRLAFGKDKEIHPEHNPVLKLLRRFLPMTRRYEGGRFIVRQRGAWRATPLLAVLLVVESTDLMFAVDSIPAILAITLDPLIVYSSNVFAILGLRALYFALAGMMRLFCYLHYGLATILAFIGVKMVIADCCKIPVGIALAVVAAILLISIAASLWLPSSARAGQGACPGDQLPPAPSR